jgi:tetratricopeptide (TPR) repeat protein
MSRALAFLLAYLASVSWWSTATLARPQDPPAAMSDAAVQPAGGARLEGDAGSAAYRRADWSTARELWLEAWPAAGSAGERARLAANLGNCAWREGRVAQAGAWYELALLQDPRLPGPRANLELVRSRLGLPPAERGDLRGAFELLLGSLRASEWRLVAVLLLCLGAALWLHASPSRRRWAAPSAILAFLACSASLLAASSRARDAEPDLGWIVLERAAELRSEPRAEAAVVADARPLERVLVLDALPGWTKVSGVDRQVGWLSDQGVFRAPR